MHQSFLKLWIIGVLAVLIGGVLAWQYFGISGQESEKEIQAGFFEGSLGYPSEFIPSDMKVCAENIATGEEYCTEDHIKDSKYTNREGYKIEVPANTYYIFSVLPSRGDYKAYYSEFVICGLKAECLSHKPIPVKVREGELVSGIDPLDWYKPLE